MAPRSIASGTVSFGLVSIPVKLFAATEASAGVSFNLLHAKCGSRLKQQYVCPQDAEVVPREAMVKGYEFQKDRYVTFAADELKALEQAASQAIEIAEFVPVEKVDPIYFEKAWFLGPDKGGAKAYRLLAEALSRAGQAAVARYAARGKQYLVLIRPAKGRLIMQQLLYADEVRPVAEIPVDDVELKEAEVQLALQLVAQGAAAEFHPEAFRDEVKERTLALIERKVQGQEILAAPAEEPRAQVIDLMEALRASVAAAAMAGGAPPVAAAAVPGTTHPVPVPGTPSFPVPGPAPAGSEASVPGTVTSAARERRKPPQRAPREEAARSRAAKK